MVSNSEPAWSDYSTPADLLASRQLTDELKRELLTRWKTDIANRLMAESEGMAASNALSATQGADTAALLQELDSALTEIERTAPR